MDRLVKNERLKRIDRGIYSLPLSSKRSFNISVSNELKQLNGQLKTQFPFASFCLWDSYTILPYMHHIPNLNYIYVDVEREIMESVFNFLNANQTKRVFLCPDKDEFNRYIIGIEAIIIRSLVSESPMQIIETIPTPSLEKILVDIISDVEFDFLQGVEMSYFYRNIIEDHSINKSKLLRYATRRGRRAEVEQLYNNAL
ncbi:MAG: hypothetical protein LBT27_07950 [Prevotellaceae bacterium]|nr:hypothetical protein [Prevotellaceae bacterium]